MKEITYEDFLQEMKDIIQNNQLYINYYNNELNKTDNLCYIKMLLQTLKEFCTELKDSIFKESVLRCFAKHFNDRAFLFFTALDREIIKLNRVRLNN